MQPFLQRSRIVVTQELEDFFYQILMKPKFFYFAVVNVYL